MREHALQPGHILIGTLFSEPMRVETVRAHGVGVWDWGSRVGTIDADLEERLLRHVDIDHFRAICQDALEGLAAKKLNLDMLIERRARAQERRVVPETIARFLVEAAAYVPLTLDSSAVPAAYVRVGQDPHGLTAVYHSDRLAVAVARGTLPAPVHRPRHG